VIDLPYGRQTITEADIAAVLAVLRSNWLTTGPKVPEFEQALAEFVGVKHAVVVNSGTAALHCAMAAIGVTSGDEVIVPSISFVATANCVVYCGGTPIFADVEAETALIDPMDVERKITPRTKAIIAMDYAGQPADYEALRAIIACTGRRLWLVADACHSLGASRQGQMAGALADVSTFSFHPVKPITTGEGGAITTNDAEIARKVTLLRNHGIDSDFRAREKSNAWNYDMVELGFNYRMPDILCALGISQLHQLPRWIARRQELAGVYDAAFRGVGGINPLECAEGVSHGYHLYVVRTAASNRNPLFRSLRAEGIGANVHYRSIASHSFYRRSFAAPETPLADELWGRLLTLPLHPAMSNGDVHRVVGVLRRATPNMMS
jgi:UDP-4-amino-4,6-dideoxy-N-acetyl-beta-L-altrosamine transaminase